MIDIHCHVLPGLDDGAPDLPAALALARAAAADGVRQLVATPHVDTVHQYDLELIGVRTDEVNAALAREEAAIAVLPGAEIALDRLGDLEDRRLRQLALGGGSSLLIESPYSGPVPFLEEALLGLRARGFRPILAHPERSTVFQRNPRRLADLVRQGVLCSVDAGSLVGRFGSRPQELSLKLLEDGLAHNIASDAHDLARRPPGLTVAFEAAERSFEGFADHAAWYALEVPGALLENTPVPPRPAPLTRTSRRGRLRRAIGRR